MSSEGRSAIPSEMPNSQDEMKALTKRFNVKSRILRNKTKGKIGEVMSSVLFDSDIRDDVVLDKKLFETPYGGRRIDGYLPATKQAVESKYTRTVASKRIRNQIKKDAYLLEHGLLREVWWVLYYGGSKRVITLLEKSGIKYTESWDELMDNCNVLGIK